MTSRRHRLHILCEDRLHRQFVEHLAERCGVGPRQRMLRASPRAEGSAAGFVLDNFVDVARQWRAESHDLHVGLLVVLDGDEHGLERRRRQLAQRLVDAGEPARLVDEPRVAVLVPTWHIETWIAWLCGHRPLDEQTRYKAVDPRGRDVGRKLDSGEYSVRRAFLRWTPPLADEASHVPTLARAREDLRRLGTSP